MSDTNILIKGVIGKDILIPVDTTIDLSDKVLKIHYESKDLNIKGELTATYYNDATLGDCVKYTTDGTETFQRTGLYNCWVVITDAAGTFLDKTFPAVLAVHYAPTIPAATS